MFQLQGQIILRRNSRLIIRYVLQRYKTEHKGQVALSRWAINAAGRGRLSTPEGAKYKRMWKNVGKISKPNFSATSISLQPRFDLAQISPNVNLSRMERQESNPPLKISTSAASTFESAATLVSKTALRRLSSRDTFQGSGSKYRVATAGSARLLLPDRSGFRNTYI